MRSDRINDESLAQYLRVVIAHIRNGRQAAAFGLLQHAAAEFPEDPSVLSYYGCLQAILEKNYPCGIENCKKALAIVSTQPGEALYPLLYLNLGKAYIAAGQRKEGLLCLYKGLKYERNDEILKELNAAGMRNTPLVPFLNRSNPINKYSGILIHRLKHSATRSPLAWHISKLF